MLPEVMQALTTREFESEELILNEFARFTMSGENYPGLIRSPGSRVSAKIYFDVDQESMRVIDCFEDKCYERAKITVRTDARGLLQARVYLVPSTEQQLLSESLWSPENFRKVHLASYLAMCAEFRAANVAR